MQGREQASLVESSIDILLWSFLLNSHLEDTGKASSKILVSAPAQSRTAGHGHGERLRHDAVNGEDLARDRPPSPSQPRVTACAVNESYDQGEPDRFRASLQSGAAGSRSVVTNRRHGSRASTGEAFSPEQAAGLFDEDNIVR